MKKHFLKKHYSLVELMVVIVFIGILSTIGLKFFYNFHRSYRKSISDSFRMRSIMLLRNQWRHAVGGTVKALPELKDGMLIFGQNQTVHIESDKIYISLKGKKYTLKLPQATSATLELEKLDSGKCLAVLKLNWRQSYSTGYNTPGIEHSVHIAALVRREQRVYLK